MYYQSILFYGSGGSGVSIVESGVDSVAEFYHSTQSKQPWNMGFQYQAGITPIRFCKLHKGHCFYRCYRILDLAVFSAWRLLHHARPSYGKRSEGKSSCRQDIVMSVKWSCMSKFCKLPSSSVPLHSFPQHMILLHGTVYDIRVLIQ